MNARAVWAARQIEAVASITTYDDYADVIAELLGVA